MSRTWAPSKSNGSVSVPQPPDHRARLREAGHLDRLVPVCAELLGAAAKAGEIRPDVEALELMRAVGNLCIGADKDTRYDARRMVGLLLAGLRVPQGQDSRLNSRFDQR